MKLAISTCSIDFLILNNSPLKRNEVAAGDNLQMIELILNCFNYFTLAIDTELLK
jgi:hypothetical protein